MDSAYRVVRMRSLITIAAAMFAAFVFPLHILAEDLPKGFKPHQRPTKGGQVNWTDGFVIADGTGIAKNNTPREKAGAQRAAELVAARNALVISKGLKVDAKGTMSNVRNLQMHVEGVIKGHKTVDVKWKQLKRKMECTLKMKVPIWGLKGVVDVVFDDQFRKAKRLGMRRVHLAAGGGHADGESILVIDARGIGLQPCLFPEVITIDNMLLYDVKICQHSQKEQCAPVRYVETEIAFDDLQSAIDSWDPNVYADAREVTSSQRMLNSSANSTALDSAFGMPAYDIFANQFFLPPPEPKKPTTQPASQPTDSRRRPRMAVKAVKRADKNPTQIVLTKEDAEKLSKSAEGAELLRNGKVIVVMDSVAAGIQGRGDDSTDPDALALLGPQ